MGNNVKYGQNQNLWRKRYYEVRREPHNVTIVTPNTFTTYSMDLQTYYRHRDMYQVQAYISRSIESQYDEGLIYLNHESQKSKDFSITFTYTPYVTYTMESIASGTNPLLSGTDNVQIFGISKTTTGSCVGVSAEISGVIRYRAILAVSYPAGVSSSYSGSLYAYGGGASPVSPELINATASYDGLEVIPNVPSNYYFTAFDDGSGEADTYISATIDVVDCPMDFSAPMSNNILINFIASDPVPY